MSVHFGQLDGSTQEMDTHVGMRILSTTIGFKLAILGFPLPRLNKVQWTTYLELAPPPFFTKGRPKYQPDLYFNFWPQLRLT